MPATPTETQRRSNTWVTANYGNIYYRSSTKKSTHATARFPRPLIEPRRSRPHAIHIITYPPGYVPHELREPKPHTPSRARRQTKVRAARAKRRFSDAANSPTATTTTTTATATTTAPAPAPAPAPALASVDPDQVRQQPADTRQTQTQRRTDRSPIRPVLGKLIKSFNTSFIQSSSRRASVSNSITVADSTPLSDTPNPSRISTSTQDCDVIRQVPESTDHQSSTLRRHPVVDHLRGPTSSATSTTTPVSRRSSAFEPLSRVPSDTVALVSPPPRPQLRSQTTTNITHKRNSFMSAHMAKAAVASVAELSKPVVSGSGVSCSILLAEPNIFLSGFDHDGHSQRDAQGGTALLRGKMQLNVSKNVKIKAVQLKLVGRARTEWPEGIPPLKQDTFEEQGLRTQVLTFFNAMNEGWETEYGNQCTYKLKNPSPTTSSVTYLNVPTPPGSRQPSSRELKRLSLQNAQSRSFGKSDPGSTTPTQAKGFKIFYPGTYDYSFELPIDHHQLESIKLQYGSVKWELQATIDRAGAFKPNLHGAKDVSIVRVPDQMSLEMTEPISISRQWEDQLHYDIIISGKSFPIGGKIPIAFKLTPLAKVQVHKLKVFATESIEYWTNDRRVTRKDPGRKVLLLEKAAGKDLDNAYSSSEFRTVRGGELSREERNQARFRAHHRRQSEAARSGVAPRPLPSPSDNILGDLDLGLESYWGSTEVEANVQIPTCEMMAKNKDVRLHPDCSWKNVNVYHWIKIVMRISRLDPEDPTGKKRRHFEISIDSPFTVLNCRATQANTVLPAYDSSNQGLMVQSACGCPDAHTVPADPSPASSTTRLGAAPFSASMENMPAMPQAAHIHNTAMNPASDAASQNQDPRPMHLLRAPSFNPPAFDEDHAPPPAPQMVSQTSNASLPLATPPPQYDVVIGTPSVDGLADYFTRLADHGYDPPEDDSDSGEDALPARILDRSGRVNVAHPRTPGGRMPSRSMEIARPNISLNMDSLPNHQTQTARG